MSETEKLTYDQAMRRLEEMAAQLECGETPIDQMAEQLKEAQRLLEWCRKQLTDAEQAVKAVAENGTRTNE